MKNFFKKLLKSLAFDVLLVAIFFVGVAGYFFFAGPEAVSADSYTPLAQDFPIQAGSGPQALGQYINSLYTLSIGIGAILAVLMIVVGGLQYMGSDIFSSKSAAKTRIQGALMGLGLLLASFLILNLINNDLVKLDVDIEVAESKATIGGISPVTFAIYSGQGIATEEEVVEYINNIDSGFKTGCSRFPISQVRKEEREEKIAELKQKCGMRLDYFKSKNLDKNYEYKGCSMVEDLKNGLGYISTCFYYK